MRTKERGSEEAGLFICIALIVILFVAGFCTVQQQNRFYNECQNAHGVVVNTTPTRIDCIDKDNNVIKVPSGDY